MKYLASFFILSLTSTFILGQNVSVLFIGNSYIYTQNLPGTLYNLAAVGGDTIYYESSTPGGYTFQQHSTNSTTLNKIASRDWDFVVLQEQSQLPSFGDGQVASQVFPYAEILVDSIRSNYECSEPVFFMTWGKRDGDQQNCAGFPALCTFEGIQERLRNAYLQMGEDNDATVAPCGAAWQQMALTNNQFWYGLFSGDGSHPSAWGTYLNACVFYATILRKSPVGLEYYSSIGETDAVVLQQLAEDIVIDSTSNWFIGHGDAMADVSYAEGTVPTQFLNNSSNIDEHYWDFGDGTTSTDEMPLHGYSTQGQFEITYIGTSACGTTDTAYFQVLIPLGVEESTVFKDIQVSNDNGEIILNNSSPTAFTLEILDIAGKLVFQDKIVAHSRRSLTAEMIQGLNLVRLSSGIQSNTYKVMMP